MMRSELVVVDERLGAAEDGIVVGRNGDRLAVQLTEPVHQPVRGTRSIRIREYSVLYERTAVDHGSNSFAGGQVAASAYLGDRFGSCRVQCCCPSGQHLVDERLIQVWRPSNRRFTTRTCARTSRMSGGLEHQQRRTPIVRIDEEWLDAHSDPYGRRFNVHQLRADPRSLIELHDCGYVQYLVVPRGRYRTASKRERINGSLAGHLAPFQVVGQRAWSEHPRIEDVRIR